MKYERELPYNVSIEDVLTELLEYMEDRADCDCDQDGYIPNKEMSFSCEIRQALFQIEMDNKK